MLRTCLIAETDPFIARLLSRFAQASDLEPVHVGAGEDVAVVARETQPALIILDIDLPGKIRGWQAATILHDDPELQAIPVIACSWLTEVEALSSADGAAGHLRKPELHYSDFLAVLVRAGMTGAPSTGQGAAEPEPSA
jgi:CheY-like chemotaxis protein